MTLHNTHATEPLRILVVENHEDSRTTLVLLLSQFGHEVRSASSVAEAMAALASTRPDVLISDIGLPDGDGWQLLRQTQLAGEVYAIAISGYGMNADRERSAAAGYRHHLVKPIEVDLLEDLLAEASKERAQTTR